MVKMYFEYLKALTKSKKGQGMVEYGLIIGLIAVVVIVALTAMGTQVGAIFDQISGKLTGVIK